MHSQFCLSTYVCNSVVYIVTVLSMKFTIETEKERLEFAKGLRCFTSY